MQRLDSLKFTFVVGYIIKYILSQSFKKMNTLFCKVHSNPLTVSCPLLQQHMSICILEIMQLHVNLWELEFWFDKLMYISVGFF